MPKSAKLLTVVVADDEAPAVEELAFLLGAGRPHRHRAACRQRRPGTARH